MGLKENVAFAEQAVHFVRSKLTNGSNTLEDTLAHPGTGPRLIESLRKDVRESKALLPPMENGKPHPLLAIALSAMMLNKYGYGHCGEQAEAAFMFLKLMSVYPLDLCRTEEDEHEVVVIGRDEGSDPNDINTWGKHAVVCDPWAKRFYPLFQYRTMQKPEHNVPEAEFSKTGPSTHYLAGNLRSIFRDKKIIGIYHSMPSDKLIVPAHMSTYRTINFQVNPNQVLFSDAVTACVVIVIRRKKIATMAHFFPNNAYDENTVWSNFLAARQDFINSGGKFINDVSITLYGGGQRRGEAYNLGPMSIIEDVLIEKGVPFTIEKNTSMTFGTGHVCVFVDEQGTQVIRQEKMTGDMYQTRLVTQPSETLPLEYMANVFNRLPRDYLEFTNSWGEHMAKLGSAQVDGKYVHEGVPLFDMELVFQKPWEEIYALICKNKNRGRNVV